ncbi:MAG: AAA family ATPase [Dehalococcoidia bacterium]|nr:AAA family ATPase [Dehalococcoidia bacterium]
MDGPAVPARARARGTRFVGREPEFASLAGPLQAAERGEPGVVLLSGEPGIGKSRLLREFSARALADGWLVLSGRAYDTEGMPPYLPFVDVLRQYVHASSDEELQPIVSAAPEITMLLPEVAARLGPVSPPLPGPESERYALFQAVSSFLAHAANSTEARGLLICLDDLHWADRSTLLLFQHLARNMAAARLCLVGTYRTVGIDAGHPLFPILADLTRERLCEAISLAPLSPEEAEALVATLTSRNTISSALIESIHNRTKGNPFFIEEVVRHLQGEGRDLDDPALASSGWGIPEGVRQVIGSRIARLSHDDRRLLQAAAILGDEFGQMFPVIARMLDVDVSGLAETVEEAVSAGMLREDGESYRFAHALIRDALLDELPLPRRQRLHLAAARATEEAYARNLDPWLSAMAAHYRMAGPFADGEKAIDYSIRAGEAARQAFAYEEAQAHWEAALGLMEQQASESLSSGESAELRARLLERLGDLMYVTDWQNGISYLERALRSFENLGDTQESARLHSKLGRSLSTFGQSLDIDRALEHYRAAEPILRAGPEQLALGHVHLGMATAAFMSLRTADGMAHSASAMTIAEGLGSDGLWASAASLHGVLMMACGEMAEGQALMQQAHERADRQNSTATFFAAWLRADIVGLVLGDAVDALEWMTRELASPQLANAPHQRRVAYAELGCDLALLGRLAEARQVLPYANPDWPLDAAIEARDNWEVAESRFAEEQEKFRKRGDRWNEWRCCLWQAQACRAGRKYAQAADLLTAGLAAVALAPFVPMEVAMRAELAILCAESGRADEAELHLARCREVIIHDEDWHGLAGRVALAQAATSGLAGCVEVAEAHFSRALATFQRYSLPWDEAETCTIRGQVLARAGRSYRYAALESFERAARIYSSHGASQPWIDHVLTIQRRAIGSRAGSAPVYPDNLTEREVEVLRLLASGLSSKDIGEALVLSVRTVERHIANLYLKTNTHGRAQATAYALSHGLGPQTR